MEQKARAAHLSPMSMSCFIASATLMTIVIWIEFYLVQHKSETGANKSLLARPVPPNSDFLIQYATHGCVYTPKDTPELCIADDVCFEEDDLVTFRIKPFSSDRWPWVLEKNVSVHSQAELNHAWNIFQNRCCRNDRNRLAAMECMRAQMLGFTCCRHASSKEKNKPRLQNASIQYSQSTFVLDTAVKNFHFGHTLSKLLQLASVLHWTSSFSPPHRGTCQPPSFSCGLFSRISGVTPISRALQDWLRFVVNIPSNAALRSSGFEFSTLSHVIFDGDFVSRPKQTNTNCFKRAYFLNDYEQYFFRPSDASNINEVAQKTFDLPACPNNKSAWRRGMLLVRSEGSGGRTFLNAKDVQNVIKRHFHLPLNNVTTNSRMGAREQARLFRDHGLIVTPHSSQLKNLATTCPCSVVIEINAFNVPGSERYPFAVGLEHRNIAYVQSTNHLPAVLAGPKEILRVDLTVNLTKLDDDVRSALELHRNLGCDVF